MTFEEEVAAAIAAGRFSEKVGGRVVLGTPAPAPDQDATPTGAEEPEVLATERETPQVFLGPGESTQPAAPEPEALVPGPSQATAIGLPPDRPYPAAPPFPIPVLPPITAEGRLLAEGWSGFDTLGDGGDLRATVERKEALLSAIQTIHQATRTSMPSEGSHKVLEGETSPAAGQFRGFLLGLRSAVRPPKPSQAETLLYVGARRGL